MSVDKTKPQQQLKTKSGSGKSVRCRPCCASTALSITAVIAIVATFLVWTTDFVRLVLVQNLGIENNTLSYKWWVSPPVRPYVAIYMFNYTNAEEYTTEIDSKLKVQEVGPYVYRTNTEKVNVVFNSNGTVSYQEKNSFTYLPERSGGHWPRQDHLTVPNIPLLSAMALLKDSSMLTQLAFLGLSAGIETPQFTHITAHDFFWGYEDQLLDLAVTYYSFDKKSPFKKFGFLAKKNGTTNDHMTIYTGKQDVNKLGVITRFNGEGSMRHWSGEECNRIDGTDGSMFPPHLIRRNATIHVFASDICRRFPLEYTEDITTRYSIPVLRFQATRSVFAKSEENPENACYCQQDREFCPPSGLLKISSCVYGVPFVVSFPHFYLGDPRLLEEVEGLNPDPEKHNSYLDVHEELGVTLDGRNRMQFNILVTKSATMSHLANFKEGSILPILWLEVGVDELPDEIMDLIYHLTFTAHQVYLVMGYVLVVLSIVLLCWLVRRFRCHSTAEVLPDVDVVMPK